MKIRAIETIQLAEFANLVWVQVVTDEGLIGLGTGPIVYAASVHLALNATNTLVQESVRAFYTGWYKEIVTELPRIAEGHVYPMTGSGLGTRLLPDIVKPADARVRRSAA